MSESHYLTFDVVCCVLSGVMWDVLLASSCQICPAESWGGGAHATIDQESKNRQTLARHVKYCFKRNSRSGT
jgi:hypothetical protein